MFLGLLAMVSHFANSCCCARSGVSQVLQRAKPWANFTIVVTGAGLAGDQTGSFVHRFAR
jgi:hypothetical protein